MTNLRLLVLALTLIACVPESGGRGPRPFTPAAQEALAGVLDAKVPAADPMGNPIDTLDRRTIVRWLEAGVFDSLEAALEERWGAARSELRHENRLYHVYDAFYRHSPTIQPALWRWREARPGRVEPLLAEARFRHAQASAARGDRTARETSREQFAAMQQQIVRAHQALDSALALVPDHIIGHMIRVDLFRLGSGEGGPSPALALQAAVQAQPASMLVRDAIMTMLEPRWGGSYEIMELFADSSQAFVDRNPNLRLLKGRASLDAASIAHMSAERMSQHLAKATQYGEDYFVALEQAHFLEHHGTVVQELVALDRARLILPQGRTLQGKRASRIMNAGMLVDGQLRERAFDEAQRGFDLLLAMRVDYDDAAAMASRLRSVRAACEGQPAPCGFGTAQR